MPPTGVPTQQTTTFPRPAKLSWRLRIPTPRMAPTTAWEVETGSPNSVIIVTVQAAAMEAIIA